MRRGISQRCAVTAANGEGLSDVEEDHELAPDLLERLMPRTEDFEENMTADINLYKDILLRKVEDYMGNHERQKVIELDANMPIKYLIKGLIQKLDGMAASRVAVPLRLQGGEDQETIPDDTETDDLLRTLAATESIGPGFRWRRSRWGRVCPVALYEGNIVQGSPQFAVSFLDKLYTMSSMDTLEKFMRNPRRYIMSPQPRNPCKLCIVGPPLSGKTTLAQRIAAKYQAKIFDVDAMIKPRKEAQISKMLDDVKREALENAIARVTAIVQQEKLAAEQAKKLQEGSNTYYDEDKKSEDSDMDGGQEETKEPSGSGNEREGEMESSEEKQSTEVQPHEEKEVTSRDKAEAPSEGMEDATAEDVTTEDVAGEDVATEDVAGEDVAGEDVATEDVAGEDVAGEDVAGEDAEDESEGGSRKLSKTGSEKGVDDVIVDENHPQVVKMVEEAVAEAMKRDISVSADECVEMLESAIHDHYNKLQESHPIGPVAGRWILDNFPHTREQFNIMVERGILPDNLICLKDNSDGGELLLKRWHKLNKNVDAANNNALEDINMDEDEMPPKSPQLDAQRSAIVDFDKNWTSLQGALRSVSNLEPVLIDCDQNENGVESEAITNLEAQFEHTGWEYTGMDQDEEEEDLAADEDEYDDDQDDEDVFNKEKRKPFGDTKHYCPVALKESTVLWPGSPDCAAKYREKVYYFSSPEARTKFLDNPKGYLPDREPLKPPALRLLVLGAKGSGKTLVGRELAKKFGVFHISFKDRLQELIIAKTKKRIGPDYPEEEPEQEDTTEDDKTAPEDSNEESSPESETIVNKDEEEEEVEFSEMEANIRDNITDNEPLTNETLEQIIPVWWNEEPFKSTGFILEGFPRNPEEVRYLTEAGLYPDCAINLATEETDIIKRLMPPLLEKWRNKRDKKFAKKQKELAIKLKKREEEKARRKEEKVKEIAQRKADRLLDRQDSLDSNEDSNDEIEEEDEEEEDIDAVIEAEMAEEEEEDEAEEEEETEEEATERIKMEITEKYDEEIEAIASLQGFKTLCMNSSGFISLE
eukprot:gene17699-9356_t